jgi:hypothetical protein
LVGRVGREEGWVGRVVRVALGWGVEVKGRVGGVGGREREEEGKVGVEGGAREVGSTWVRAGTAVLGGSSAVQA